MAGYERGFESLTSEREAVDLPVAGDLPGWLSGALVRNGPADFRRADHWFDGLAMLHRFGFDGAADRVTYTNRFLRSDAYEAARAGEPGPGEFAAAEDAGLLGRLRALLLGDPTDNANVHVARLGGEFVALTETPRAVGFDPATLETTGHPEFGGATVHHVVAHLRRDRETGATWGVGTRFGLRPRYQVFRVPAGDRTREPVASVRVSRPAYIHSLALTPRHAVVVEPPFTLRPRDLLSGGGFVDNFEWRPDRGTRFLLVDRETGAVTERRTDAFFTFHLVNAFETDGTLVVDLVAYDDAGIVEQLYLDALGAVDPADGQLRRYRLDLGGDEGAVASETLYEGTELPRFSPAVAGQPYGYVYGQATHREGMNGLVKVDVEMGLSQEWWEEGLWVEEPVFVPDPEADREDAGVVLATALDAAAERTDLLVFNGTTLTERARVELPHAVPFGFHGRYFPEL